MDSSDVDDELLPEATERFVPAFDCPACSGVTERHGADNLEPVEECDDCGQRVRIVQP